MDLKELCSKHGLNQKQVSEMGGKGASRPTVSRYLGDGKPLPLDCLVAMRRRAVEEGNVPLALDLALMIRARTVIQVGPPMSERMVVANLLGEISWELKQLGRRPAEIRKLMAGMLS